MDGELAASEQTQIEQHIDTCEACCTLVERHMEEQSVLALAHQEMIQAVTETIDWDAFSLRVADQIAEQATHQMAPVMSIADALSVSEAVSEPQCVEEPALALEEASQNTSTSSWLQNTVDWIRSHPTVLLASTATAGIFLLFALPMLDPGPSNDKDVVVDRIIKTKTARVSVLQTKNKTTGHSMVIIDVKEPPSAQDSLEPKEPGKNPSKKEGIKGSKTVK